MFFQVSEKLFKINVLTLSVRGDNHLICYIMRPLLAVIPLVPSCLFTMATDLFIQKNIYSTKHDQWRSETKCFASTVLDLSLGYAAPD